jgi:hypothetical protein
MVELVGFRSLRSPARSLVPEIEGLDSCEVPPRRNDHPAIELLPGHANLAQPNGLARFGQ